MHSGTPVQSAVVNQPATTPGSPEDSNQKAALGASSLDNTGDSQRSIESMAEPVEVADVKPDFANLKEPSQCPDLILTDYWPSLKLRKLNSCI